MAHTRHNTLLRSLMSCAKILQTLGTTSAHRLGSLYASFWHPHQNLPGLTDAQARDIGLDLAHLEMRRHKWPSGTSRHPML